jgi:hypothetical protein
MITLLRIAVRPKPLMFALQEGKKVKSYSGFHGKGYKFDEMEEQLASERKKAQRAALGLQDSDDEDGGVDVSTQRSLEIVLYM